MSQLTRFSFSAVFLAALPRLASVMAFPPHGASNAHRKSERLQEISSKEAVQYFLAELDAAAEGENREACICAVLLRALFHPNVYFFAELLRHPAVVAISGRRAPHKGVAIGHVLSLTRLFSLGTTDEYRRKREERRRESATRTVREDSGDSSSSSPGPPPLLPVLLRKLRLLTTLTLASYTEELSLSCLAAALSVSEEDVAGSAHEFVDSLLLGLDSSSALDMREHATSADSRCSFRRTLSDTVILSSAQAMSAISEFGDEGIAKPVLGAEDAEDIVLANMQLGWLRGKVDAESGVLFVKSVAGRDVDTKDDLEVMKLVLQDFGNRVEGAVAMIQRNISTARREAEEARSRSEIGSTGCRIGEAPVDGSPA